MMSLVSPFLNPMRVFSVRAIASLGQPADSQAALRKYRTALLATLGASGIDMENVIEQPSVSFLRTKPHALIVWYDVPCDALRLFAPPLEVIDDTTGGALVLLNGSVTTDLDTVPIEDVDAITRMMALMSVGGDDAADLHARFIAPRLDRYDEDFSPPSVEDLDELWRRNCPYYFGGTSTPPSELDVWVARASAFGVGHVERPAPAKAPKRAKRARKSGARIAGSRVR